MQKYFKISTFYLILGLLSGVFYREFTKFNNFTGATMLSVVHTHTLVLGFLFFILVLLLEKNFSLSNVKGFNSWFITYNIGLIYLVSVMIFRGVLQVNGSDFDGLSHIAGLGHAIIGISLVWFSVLVNKSLKIYDKKLSTQNN